MFKSYENASFEVLIGVAIASAVKGPLSGMVALKKFARPLSAVSIILAHCFAYGTKFLRSRIV